jgi:hypothetical protein
VETGDRWATDAVKLGAFKEQESNNSYTIEIVDYEVSLPAIMLTLLDFYDQEVVIESEGLLCTAIRSSQCLSSGMWGELSW